MESIHGLLKRLKMRALAARYDSPGIDSIPGPLKILQIRAQDFTTIPGAAQVFQLSEGAFHVYAHTRWC